MKNPETIIVDLRGDEEPINIYNEDDFDGRDNEISDKVSNLLGFQEDNHGLTRDEDGVWRHK